MTPLQPTPGLARPPRCIDAPRPRRAGFTLLEVLVALVVVSLALLAALRAGGGLQDDAERYRESVLAEQCAQNYLVEQRLRQNFVGTGVHVQACTQADRSFTLRTDVQPTPNPNFRRVDLSVLDASGWAAWKVVAIVWNQ
jgi:general secretion pathway protein I